MSRRLPSLLLALALLVPAGGCQLMGSSGKRSWNPFRTASDEILAEPAIEDDDDWKLFPGRAGRGVEPGRKEKEKRKSRIGTWFSTLEDPRPGQINRNLGD